MHNRRVFRFAVTSVSGILFASAAFPQAPGGTNTPAPATAGAAGSIEILVTATRTENPVADVPASVQVIDPAAVREAHAVTVNDLLRKAAGVDLQGGAAPGEAVKVNLRGMTTGYQSERVLVLMDGRRINDQFQGNVEFALLPADNVERIEILRGPASALYGSNAEGGVINIITKKGGKTPVTQVRAGAGSFDSYEFRAAHGWKTGKFDYFLTAGRMQTRGYADNSDGTDRDWSACNFSGNFGWQLTDDSELRFYSGGYFGEGADENADRESTKDYQDLLYSLRWSEKQDARLQVRAYRNGEHHIYDWKFPGRGVYRQQTLGGSAQQSLWIGDMNRLTAGIEGREDAVDVDDVMGPIDRSSSVVGVYGQDEIHLFNDSLRITAGVREDFNQDYGDQFSPRLGVLYRLSDEAEVFASANRAHRAPALSDRYVKTMFNGMTFEGNPDLDPETLTAYEVGGRVRLGDRLSAEVATYRNDLDDVFDYVMDADGVFRSRNITRALILGAESSLRFRICKALSVRADYTYTDGRYEEFPENMGIKDGNRLAYLARDQATLALDYTCPITGGSAVLEGRYVGPRYGDPQNTDENRMDGYIVAAAHVRFPLGKKVQLTADVNNILDETYRTYPKVDEPGRNFMAGVEVTF